LAADYDGDGYPDSVDDDIDGDGVLNQMDNCLYSPLGFFSTVGGIGMEMVAGIRMRMMMMMVTGCWMIMIRARKVPLDGIRLI
jgi:hypothetical protein